MIKWLNAEGKKGKVSHLFRETSFGKSSVICRRVEVKSMRGILFVPLEDCGIFSSWMVFYQRSWIFGDPLAIHGNNWHTPLLTHSVASLQALASKVTIKSLVLWQRLQSALQHWNQSSGDRPSLYTYTGTSPLGRKLVVMGLLAGVKCTWLRPAVFRVFLYR